MRKIFFRAVALAVLILGMWTMPAWAAEPATFGTCGPNLRWEINRDLDLVISGFGPMYDYQGYEGENSRIKTTAPWQEENDRLFNEEQHTIDRIILPEGMTTVGDYAFASLFANDELIIPSSVVTIGDYAFYGNQFSGDLTIPGSVKEVGDHAFDCDFSYSELILIEGLETIGDYAFCGGFEGNLYIPNTIKTIGARAFSGNYELTGNLRIPDSVTSIGDGAFTFSYNDYWGEIGTLTLGNGLKTIGANAFEYCGFTGDLVIPDSVEIIGDHAFDDCSEFDGTLTLGKGLRTIGEFAFNGCDGFTGDLIIPDNVKTIKRRAFKSCEGFDGDLIIGNGLFRIEEAVFYECTGFQGKLVLSESLRSIASHAFCDCSGLTGDLKIPYYVTDIGKYAFNGCDSITGKLELPNSLKTIGESAFDCPFTGDLYMPMNVTEIGAGALNDAQFDSIKFMGNAPTVTPAEEWNSSFSPDVTLYYSEAASGWTSPTWNGYKTATWVPSGFIEVEIQNVPATYYNLLLQDSDGNPVVEAIVTWNEQSEKSDSEGMVSFWHDPDEPASICIEAQGFQSLTIDNYTPLKKGYDMIRCIRNEESGLRLVNANFNNIAYPEDRADLLAGYKRLIILEGATQIDAIFELECEALLTDLVNKYVLYQGDNFIAASTDGDFEGLEISQFKENEDVYVRVYDINGQYADTYINLYFTEDDFFKNYKFAWNWKKLDFVIHEDIPLFGGDKVSLELPEFFVAPEIYIQGDKVRVGFSVPIKPDLGEWFDETEASVEQLERISKIFKENPKLNKELKEKITSIAKESSGEIPLLGEWDFSIVCYAEGTYNYNGQVDFTLNIGLLADGEKTKKGPMFFPFGIPVSTMIDFEAEGSAIGSVHYSPEEEKYTGEGLALNMTPDGMPFVGAGFYDIASGGFYGSFELPTTIQVIPSSTKPMGITMDFMGDLGVKLYFLFASYEHPWVVFDPVRIIAFPEYDSTSEMMLFGESIYDAGNYTLADTSYLSNESDWLGGDELMLMDLEQTGIQELQTSTYRNMQPQIVSVGDNLVMVWTGADTSREDYNLTQLKYSVFDGISWSEPQAVDSNETADYLHDVYSDGENLWVIYQESATVFDDEPSMEEAAADMQIVAAKFDISKEEFVDHTALSNEGGYESIPAITIVEGKPYVVWTSNSDTTDLFGQNDTNEVHYAEFDGEWSAAQVLASDLGPVTDLTVGDLEGTVSVAYITSEDDSLETDNDNVLYIADFDGNMEEVSDGVVSALKFAELPDASESSLVWYDNGKLKTLQDGDTETVIRNATAYAAGFDVLSDRIIFNHATDGASDVFAAIYEDGEYQEPVRMTYQDSYIQSYSFVEHNSKAFAALVQTDVTITEDAVEDDCTLSFLTFEGVTDVSLESAAYDDADLVAGEDLPVEVILKNTGDTLIKKVQLTIMDENNEVYASVTETVDLASHEEVTLTVDLPIGDTIHKQVYTVKATAENDANADNNSWQILVGDEMLSVSGEMIRSGSNVKAIVKVLNDGHETTGGTLTISSVSDGTVLIEKELTELAAGESHLLILDGEYLLNGKESDVLQLAVETTAGNNYSANRMQQMYISRAIVEEETVENTLNISEVDGNVIGVEISNTEDVDVAVAVYDAEGKMLAYEISTDIRSNIYNYETFVMDLPDITEGQTVKVFMMKTGELEPLCEAVEYDVK